MVTIERNMLKRICVKFDWPDQALKTAFFRLFETSFPQQVQSFWTLLKSQKTIYHEQDGIALRLEVQDDENFSVTIEVPESSERDDEAFPQTLAIAYEKLYPLLHAALSDYIVAARTYEIIRKPLFEAVKKLLKVAESRNESENEVVKR